MMLQPTEEQKLLYKKLEQTTDEEEKAKIRQRLKEIAIERNKELDDTPFCH